MKAKYSHVGGVGVGEPAATQCPDYGDYQGCDRVGGQSPEEAFTFELLQPREGPEKQQANQSGLHGDIKPEGR